MNWRRFFTYAGLLALVLAAVLNFGHISQFAALLHKARWYILSLVLVVQAFSYFSNAKYYQSFLKIFGYKIGLRRLFEMALAINFVNQVFPSGGISGTSFISNELGGVVPVGKSTLAQLARYVFTFLSFVVVLVIGFLWLFLANNDTRVSVKFALLLILGIIIGSFLLILAISDRSRIETAGKWVVKIINRLSRLVSRRRRKVISPAQLKHFFDEFYHGYNILLAEKGKWLKPLAWTLAGSFAEVMTVYVVFWAFAGHLVNPGIVIAGYTLANLFSLLAVVTGGVGLYEATMVASFVTLGVSLALAVSVVVVYRVLNFVLFLPFGFYFYHRRLEH